MCSDILTFTASAAWVQIHPALPTPVMPAACTPWQAVCRYPGSGAGLLSGLLLGICWAALLAYLAPRYALLRTVRAATLP